MIFSFQIVLEMNKQNFWEECFFKCKEQLEFIKLIYFQFISKEVFDFYGLVEDLDSRC